MRRFFLMSHEIKFVCVDEARKSHKNSLHAVGKALAGKISFQGDSNSKKSLSHSFCSTNAANELLRVAMVGN